MAGRTLSQRELNRALLARQLLLERVRLPIPRALERLGGIQDQYAPNAYIRLWSCLEGIRRDDLTRALERRSVVQATLMRSTIHVVSRRDYWPFAVAIRAPQRDWWLRTRKPRPAEGELEPAPRGDIAQWAGMRLGDVAPALDRLPLRRFRDERGGELLDLPRAALPDPETPTPVRFLPTWDAILLVHTRRTGVLPERYRPLIFTTKMPQSVGTFLIDGAVAGTWRYEDGRVRWEAFDRVGRTDAREVDDEAERLAATHD